MTMKATLITVLACALVADAAHGQNQPPSNLQDMTPASFAAQVKTANTGSDRASLASAAFHSQNIELILICFREPGMFGSFIDELEKLPQTEIRSKVARALLTETWPQDKSTLGMLPPGSAPPPRLETFCLEELRQLLPSANLTPGDPASIDKLRGKEFRITLSKEVEARMTSPQNKLPNSSANSPSPQEKDNGSKRLPQESPPKGSSVKPAGMAQPSTAKANEARSAVQAPNEAPASSMPWSIIVVLIVAAGGLLWLLLKRRS